MPLFRRKQPVSITVFCFCLNRARRPSKSWNEETRKGERKQKRKNPRLAAPSIVLPFVFV